MPLSLLEAALLPLVKRSVFDDPRLTIFGHPSRSFSICVHSLQ